MNLTNQPQFQKPPKPTPAEIKAGKAHMARVAQLPCVICNMRPVEVHHCICDRFSGKKASDFHTIPLCVRCHRIGDQAIHNNKAGWVRANGKDYKYLSVTADLLAGELN